MIQGTMSGAGKSFLVAGLCRIMKQDGYRVAPFKSQNMALNSFITEEGLEMGRAQVMQAEAAGIKPMVCMNPILLKPTNHTGSQVIVNGEVKQNGTSGGNELLLNKDGRIYNAYGKTADQLVNEGVKYSFSCHSTQVIENGDTSPSYRETRAYKRNVFALIVILQHIPFKESFDAGIDEIIDVVLVELIHQES